MVNLEMCVKGGADINRLAWRRAGRGPAHGADSVRSSLPILMRHCEDLGSGLQQGPPASHMQSHRQWRVAGGSS